MEAAARAVLLVYGCPGSGKTTFSKQLAMQLGKDVLLVSGDEVESILASSDIESMQQKLSSYQQAKEDTGRRPLNISEILNCSGLRNSQFNPEIWKASRQFVKDNIGKLTSIAHTTILEDDFLLGSTRKYFRNFCAKQGFEFTEVYMDSMLEQCIEFNKQRPNRLSEHVIRDKHSKLEISGLRIKPQQRAYPSTFQKIFASLAVPPTHQEEHSQPVNYARELELTDIEIRRQISTLMKSPQLLAEAFGRHPPPMKQASQLISTFKRSYHLKQGSANFLPALKQWLTSSNQPLQ